MNIWNIKRLKKYKYFCKNVKKKSNTLILRQTLITKSLKYFSKPDISYLDKEMYAVCIVNLLTQLFEYESLLIWPLTNVLSVEF